jgi:hypothetical protein
VKTPCEDLADLTAVHGIPETMEPMPEWRGAFLDRHQVWFAKPEYVIDWLKRPGKWMLGEQFSMDD